MKNFNKIPSLRVTRDTFKSLNFLLLFCSSALMAQISNQQFHFSCPGGVTITYDLATCGGNATDVTLWYSTDMNSWAKAMTVTGAVGTVAPGNGKTIVWDNAADNVKNGNFYFKITSAPIPGALFKPVSPVPAGQYVDITVNGKIVGGVFVGSTTPPYDQKTMRFLTYNLGANPNLTPKQQMASFPMQPTDPTVYGGFYQWGRKDSRHTFRCAPTPNVNSDPKFTETLILTASLPDSDDGKFVWGANVDATNSYNWASPHIDNSNLWGNGGGFATQSNTTYTPPQNSQNPCPSGYRVPTQHEWALLGQEGGSATTPTSDTFNTPTSVTLSRSNLYWVKVVNGRASSTFASGGTNLCGYAIYNKDVWEAAAPDYAAGTLDLFSDFAPEPLLFLPAAGIRYYNNGALGAVGGFGHYWSSMVSSYYSYNFRISGSDVSAIAYFERAYGRSVRCVAE